MTREQNIVITAYGILTAMFAGIVYHKFSVFFMVGFGLAYILKIVNSVAKKGD